MSIDAIGAVSPIAAAYQSFGNGSFGGGVERAPVVQGTTKVEARNAGYSDSEISQMLKTGQIECQTCKNRQYVDGSDDPGVSFKTPTNLTPSQASTAVASHEMEHVAHNASEARKEGKTASSSVTIFHAICPECGASYVSGGVTRTQTRKLEETTNFADKQYNDTVGKYINKDLGGNVNAAV